MEGIEDAVCKIFFVMWLDFRQTEGQVKLTSRRAYLYLPYGRLSNPSNMYCNTAGIMHAYMCHYICGYAKAGIRNSSVRIFFIFLRLK
jgi:hypothetical protein